MLYNTPYYPIPTGYINATGFLKFDINQFNNFDYISINDNRVFYNNDLSEFNSSEFFNSTGNLIENINNNVQTYGVKLTSINNTIFIDSLISGEDGNNILLSSNNNSVTFNNNQLEGGKNIYSLLKKPRYPLNKNDINQVSPLFTGNYSDKFYVTGFYYSLATTAFLEGNINSFVGIRNFEDIWNISTGSVVSANLINFKNNNYFSGNNYYHNSFLGRTRIPINLQISYNNVLSAQNNIDVAELRIRDLNAPTLTRLSGIIFRITGLS